MIQRSILAIVTACSALMLTVATASPADACHRYIPHWQCSDSFFDKQVGVYHDWLNSGSNIAWRMASTAPGLDVRSNALIPAIAEWESALRAATGFPHDEQQFSEAPSAATADLNVWVVDALSEFPPPPCYPLFPDREETVAATCRTWDLLDNTRQGIYMDSGGGADAATNIYLNDYDLDFLAYDGWESILSHELAHCCAVRTDGTQLSWNPQTGAPHTVVQIARFDQPCPTCPYRILSINERVGATGPWIVLPTSGTDLASMQDVFAVPPPPGGNSMSSVRVTATQMDVTWEDSAYAESHYVVMAMACTGSGISTCDAPGVDPPVVQGNEFSGVAGAPDTPHGAGSDLFTCPGSNCVSFGAGIRTRRLTFAFTPGSYYRVCVAAFNYPAGQGAAQCDDATVRM